MRNLYKEVTDRIIAELEAGAVPWVKPWSTTPGLNVPRNIATGREYHGMNKVRRLEVKCRGNSFRELYRWLTNADVLVVRANRSEPLVVLPLKLATEIAEAAENSRPKTAPTGAHPGFASAKSRNSGA